MGNVYLLGADSNVWESESSEFDLAEMVCLLPRQRDSSRSVTALRDYLLQQYHYLIGHRFKRPDHSTGIHGNTVRYSHERVEILFAAIGAVVGSLLLVSTIVVLYAVKNTEMRLLTLGFFTTGFSLALCLFTNGRMVEIFSATAA